MLSKIIVKSYKTLIEVILWLSLIGTLVGSFSIGMQPYGATAGDGILVMVVGFILWLIAAVGIFGTVLVLNDIRERVKVIEESNS